MPESRDLFAHPRRYEAAVGGYRFSKADCRQALTGAYTRLAERLGAAG